MESPYKFRDGGPAFPVLERGSDGLELSNAGMSLRDYFAGIAMQTAFDPGSGETFIAYAANLSYQMADAMLAEREKGNNNG